MSVQIRCIFFSMINSGNCDTRTSWTPNHGNFCTPRLLSCCEMYVVVVVWIKQLVWMIWMMTIYLDEMAKVFPSKIFPRWVQSLWVNHVVESMTQIFLSFLPLLPLHTRAKWENISDLVEKKKLLNLVSFFYSWLKTQFHFCARIIHTDIH